MTFENISEKLKEKFPGAFIESKAEGTSDPYVKISAQGWQGAALFLRDDPDMKFESLMCLSGVDYGKGTLGAVYNLYSMTNRHKINIKIEVPKDNAEIPSVASVWPTANWHEREAYDLIGIKFTGHPDLRRILMPDDWVGHPLQKDYKPPEFYGDIKVSY